MARRRHKRKLQKDKLRKGVYIIPNLFTTVSLLCGFVSLIFTHDGNYIWSAWMILAAAFFDAMDGLMARLTRASSLFGMEYDSLSDVVSFGVAPGFLFYRWALEPLGRMGMLAAFVLVVCAALRLARYNVLSTTEQAKGFRGLPTTTTACTLTTLLLFYDFIGGDKYISRGNLFLFFLLLFSFLMVSEIPYPSQKDFNLSQRRAFEVLLLLILILVLTAAHPEVALFGMFFIYSISGPIVWAIKKVKKGGKEKVKTTALVDER